MPLRICIFHYHRRESVGGSDYHIQREASALSVQLQWAIPEPPSVERAKSKALALFCYTYCSLRVKGTTPHMNTPLKNALDIFAQLLPDYLPPGPGNPNDLHRWIDVCYMSCATDTPIDIDDVAEAIFKHHSDANEETIYVTANNFMQEYEEYRMLLDYLKSRNLLVLPK